jgi:hypothetical protein
MADPAYIVDGVLTDGEAVVAIDTEVVGSATGYVEFEDPADGSSLDWCQFQDLMILCHMRGTHSATSVGGAIHFNDITGGYYNFTLLDVDNNSVRAYSEASGSRAEVIVGFPGASSTANIFGGAVIHINDVNSGNNKQILTRFASDQANTTTHGCGMTVCQFRKSDPISKIKLFPGNGNWAVGTRFDLYGILPRMVQ